MESATAGGVSAGSIASSVRMPSTQLKKKKKQTKEAAMHALPKPADMAMKVLDAMDGPVPPEVTKSPEPYRAMMYHLGFKAQDGTPWWNAVMDEIG